MKRFVAFLKYTAMSIACIAIVGTIVVLETQTDIIADIRVGLGMSEGRVSNNSLSFNSTEEFVDRVVNWRAYSGQNRHLPRPLEGWKRRESGTSRDAIQTFMAGVVPEAQADPSPNHLEIMGLPADEVARLEAASRMAASLSGFKEGGAVYENAEGQRFMMVLRRTPKRFGGMATMMKNIERAMSAGQTAAPTVAMGGRVFHYKQPYPGYIVLEGDIGNLYTLVIAGNAPIEDITEHVEQMDLYRLAGEGRDATDPLDALGPIGKAVVQAQMKAAGQEQSLEALQQGFGTLAPLPQQ